MGKSSVSSHANFNEAFQDEIMAAVSAARDALLEDPSGQEITDGVSAALRTLLTSKTFADAIKSLIQTKLSELLAGERGRSKKEARRIALLLQYTEPPEYNGKPQNASEDISSLGLPPRICNALGSDQRNGESVIVTVQDLIARTAYEISMLRNMGTGNLLVVLNRLHHLGLSLKDEYENYCAGRTPFGDIPKKKDAVTNEK